MKKMRVKRGEHPEAAEVIEHLKAVISATTSDHVKSDLALSRYLSVSQQAVSLWRKKGKISYDEIVELAYNLIFPISLDEVLLGRHSIEHPWLKEPLADWSIVGMNHYHQNRKKYLFVAMVKNGRCIVEEGTDGSQLWNRLCEKAMASETRPGGTR